MAKQWKCLVCKEEVEDNEPCKCMRMKMGHGRNYGHKGSSGYNKAKKALEELKRYSP